MKNTSVPPFSRLWKQTGALRLFALLLFVATIASGCRELSVHVKMAEDGSAVITEKLCFTKEILDLDANLKEGRGLLECLSRDSAQKRAEFMGKDAKLLSHEVTKQPDGGVACTAVYAIPDINELRVFSPYIGQGDNPTSLLRFEVGPCYSRRHASPDRPGFMYVRFWMEKSTPVAKPGEKEKTGQVTLRDLQILRDLQPMFRDWFKDSRIRLTFEGYETFTVGPWPDSNPVTDRGGHSASRVLDLLDCSGSNLDILGRSVFDNEELMLEFLRGDFLGPNMMAQLGDGGNCPFRRNATLPLAFPGGPSWMNERYAFQSSDYHRKRYFDGRPKSQTGNLEP